MDQLVYMQSKAGIYKVAYKDQSTKELKYVLNAWKNYQKDRNINNLQIILEKY